MIDCHTDVILCMSFNTDGSLLTTTCKDKKLRVIEPRSGRVLQVAPSALLRGRRCRSLWRNGGDPASASHPRLRSNLSAQGRSQPVGTLMCYGQEGTRGTERALSCRSDISSKGDSSACCNEPSVPESLGLPRPHRGS